MKIALYSDLHREFNKNLLVEGTDADVIVLAGDIAKVEDALSFADDLVARYQLPVIYVPGNHEYFGHDLDRLNQCLNDWKEPTGLVHVLVNRSIKIGDVRFIGTPLWTDFSLWGPDAALKAEEKAVKYLPDFKGIRRNEGVLTVEDAKELHRNAREFLRQEMASASEPLVVITHFAPHEDCCAPNFRTSPLTPYFISDCSDLIEEYQPKLWLFGHTHHSVDYQLGGTRIVANQHGYPHEVGKTSGFDPQKRLEI